MKKTLLFIFPLCIFFLSAKAQIPNAGFENWTDNGEYETLDDYFTSHDIYFPFGQAFGVVYSSSVLKVAGRTGDYAVAVKNATEYVLLTSEFTDTIPGFIALWKSDSDIEGMAISQRPTALTGYFKFNQGALPSSETKDTARIYVVLTKTTTAGQEGDSIGGGLLNIYETTTEWTPFTVPINYINGSTPDSLFFGVMSSLQVEPDPDIDEYTIHPATQITVDDIALVGVTGNKIPLFAKGVQTYPNPAVDEVHIKNIPQGAALIQVVDYTGAQVKTVIVGAALETINTSDLNTGLYHYSIIDTNGELIYASRFSVAR